MYGTEIMLKDGIRLDYDRLQACAKKVVVLYNSFTDGKYEFLKNVNATYLAMRIRSK